MRYCGISAVAFAAPLCSSSDNRLRRAQALTAGQSSTLDVTLSAADPVLFAALLSADFGKVSDDFNQATGANVMIELVSDSVSAIGVASSSPAPASQNVDASSSAPGDSVNVG